jgi:hypothetical protein
MTSLVVIGTCQYSKYATKNVLPIGVLKGVQMELFDKTNLIRKSYCMGPLIFFVFCSSFVTITFDKFPHIFDSTHLQVPVT